MQIGIRVAGSWIAASAALVIALWLAGPSRVPGRVAAAKTAKVLKALQVPPAADLSVPLQVMR